MDFASQANAKSLVLLLNKNNKEWVKIMQSMMMIGFQNDPKIKTAKLLEKDYKFLKMDIRNQSDVIEEVIF